MAAHMAVTLPLDSLLVIKVGKGKREVVAIRVTYRGEVEILPFKPGTHVVGYRSMRVSRKAYRKSL